MHPLPTFENAPIEKKPPDTPIKLLSGPIPKNFLQFKLPSTLHPPVSLLCDKGSPFPKSPLVLSKSEISLG